MNIENERFDQAIGALDELSKDASAVVQLAAAMRVLDGFTLTGASQAIRDSIDQWGVRYNRTMVDYTDSTSGEVRDLSESDASALASQLRETCELIRSEESERLLARLRTYDGTLPEAEIKLARRHREWFFSRLMQECVAEIEKLEQSHGHEEETHENQRNSIPFYFLYLASEWDVAESVPVIMRGLTLPSELTTELFGDAIHEQLPKYLAQFTKNNIECVDALILDPAIDVFVRWSAVKSYTYFVRDKVVSLEDAVRRLDCLFEQTKVIGENGKPGLDHCYELSAGFMEVIDLIGGVSYSTVARDKEQWEFVDTWIISPDDVLKSSSSTDTTDPTSNLSKLGPTRISDCIELLRHWASFAPRDSKPPTSPREPTKPGPIRQPIPIESQPKTGTIRQPERTQRNATCPCGSGRK